jgi:hypothetical protein
MANSVDQLLTSPLPKLTLYDSFFAASHLGQDDIGRAFRLLRLIILVGQPLIERPFFDTTEGSSADHMVRDDQKKDPTWL